MTSKPHTRLATWLVLLAATLVGVPALAGDGGAPAPELPEPKPAPRVALPFEAPHAPRAFAVRSNWPPVDPLPAIDVLDYALDLEFELNGREVAGTATITLRWENDPDATLTLDRSGLGVTAVRRGGGLAVPFTQPTGALDIDLSVGGAPAAGDTVTVEIDYFIVQSPAYVAGTPGSFTFTEPEGSPAWFPCHDVPWDKATLTLTGTCVAGRTVVSNGRLVSRVDDVGTSTFTWRMDQPIATYLIAAAVGEYSDVQPPFTVTPLHWYVFPGNEASATTAFSRVDTMIAFFSDTLVPWPYPKYGQVEGNFGGGMEHTTCTLMGSVIVNAGLAYEWVTVHELAHQWFGDWVTLESWQDIWLNEGFATFYDVAWHEAYFGAATFKSRMDADEATVLAYEAQSAANRHAIVDPPPDRLFDTLEYKKGSWVLRMLRDVVGKPVYGAAITDYLTLYGGSSAGTADFRAVVEAHHGADLGWFFDPWLTGTGSPEITWHPVVSHFGNAWQLQIDATQTQITPTLFRLPVDVRVTTTAGDVTVTGWIEAQHEVLGFEFPDEPLAVVMDPDNKLLGTFTEAAITAAETVAPARPLRAWPNPFTGALRVAAPGDAVAPLTVEVFDARGRRVRRLDPLPPGTGMVSWDGRDETGREAGPGVYFVRVRETGEAIRVVRLER